MVSLKEIRLFCGKDFESFNSSIKKIKEILGTSRLRKIFFLIQKEKKKTFCGTSKRSFKMRNFLKNY